MIQVKFDGQDLVEALKKLPPRVGKRFLREALEEAAEPIRKSIASRAPRQPPHPDMADHIIITSARGIDRLETAVAIGPAKRFFYGYFVEFGTSTRPAHPFARPAFDENWQKSLGIISASIWRELAGRGISRRTVIAPSSVIGEEV